MISNFIFLLILENPKFSFPILHYTLYRIQSRERSEKENSNLYNEFCFTWLIYLPEKIEEEKNFLFLPAALYTSPSKGKWLKCERCERLNSIFNGVVR